MLYEHIVSIIVSEKEYCTVMSVIIAVNGVQAIHIMDCVECYNWLGISNHAVEMTFKFIK